MKRRWVDDCGLRGVALCPANLKKKIMIDVPVRDIRDNLVFSTDFRNFIGNDIKDQSGNIADVTNSGAVRKTGYGCGKSLSFDGSDDYCKQKVYDTQQGTVKIATVNGGAVLWDDGQDFTDYAGAAGSSKGYIAVVSDAEGEVAGGYIGEEGGGETLGSELITNGDFANWTGDDPDGWIVQEDGDASSNVTEDANGCRIIRNPDVTHIRQDITTVGKLYKVVIVIYAFNAGILEFRSGTTGGIQLMNTATTYTFYYTAEDAIIYLRGYNPCDVIIQSISIKEVTDFPANESIKLYSTKTGSTQNLAWNEASFDPNDTLTYEVRKSDFQITGAFSICCMPRLIALSDWGILCSKYDYGVNKRSFRFGYNDDRDLIFIISSDGINTKVVTDPTASIANNWYFACITFSPSTYMKIFSNGQERQSETSGIYASLFDTDFPFILGGNYNSGTFTNKWNSKIGLIFIYDRILTTIEIQQLYNYLLRKLGVAR